MLLSFDVKLQRWRALRCKCTQNATFNLRAENYLFALRAGVQLDPVSSIEHVHAANLVCLACKSLKRPLASQTRTKTALKKGRGGQPK